MKRKKILIAEDDKNIADLLKTSLEPFGYDILVVNNGEDACMSFVKHSPDLILLDILMPKMNGYQVLEWIRSRNYRNDVPIVMISGVYRKKEQQEEAINKFGASDFLIKPFRIDNLLDRIRHHLNQKEDQPEPEEEIILESEISKFSYVGKLAENPIESLLNLLFVERETGKLVLRKKKLRIHLYFRNGNLIFAQSNIKKFTLAHYFFEARKLSRKQYVRVEKLVKKKKKSREEAIRKLGFLSDEEIRVGMSLLFQDIVYLAFKWDIGDYYFVRHREPKSGSWQLLQSTANLIMGGIRRIATLPRMESRLPQAHEVLQKSQNPLERFQNVSLKTEEKEILSLVDGRRNFGILENMTSLISPRARFILYGLMVSRLLEVKRAASAADDLSMGEEIYIEEEEEITKTEPIISVQNTGGNLLIEPLPALFFACYQNKFSGEVVLDNEDIVKNVNFDQGNIVYAHSNIEEERLGNILFDLGRIDHKRFAKAMRTQTKDKTKRIGTVLLDMGFLTEDQLRLALQHQIKKIVLDTFTWKKGSYILKEKEIDLGSEVQVSINTPNLIMDALRNIKDDKLLKRFLPREDVPLQKIQNFDIITRNFDFTEGERQILKMIDGKKTLKDLTNIFKIGRLNIYGFFYGLYTMKLLEVMYEIKREPVLEAFEKEDDDVELELNRPEPPPDEPESPPEELPELPPSEQEQTQAAQEIEKALDQRESAQNMFDEYYKIVQTGDFYRILDIEKAAPSHDIKKSFRILAKQFHPDTIYNTGISFTPSALNEIFLKINEAYQTLINPATREQYDRDRPDLQPGETVEDLKLRADMASQEGLKLMRNDKPLDAADHFREAIRMFPQKSLYHTRLVEAYLNAQVPARRIIRNALEAVRLDPNLPEAHFILAKVYFQLNDRAHTLQEIDKTLELDPSNKKAHEWKEKNMAE